MRTIMKKRVVRRTKTDNQKIHFQVRCLQRLGFLVDHDELVQLIQNGKLDLIEKQTGYKLVIKDKSLIVDDIQER